MATSAAIAEKLKNAELVLNIDGGGGVLDETTGKPLYFTWQGAEKSYADFSSPSPIRAATPRCPAPTTPSTGLPPPLLRIQAHRFPPEANDLTRAYFQSAAKFAPPQTAAAMRAFAANPHDPQADRRPLAPIRR